MISGRRSPRQSNCGFSRKVLIAADNLHLGERLPVRNITEDQAAFDDLKNLAGKTQAPCLVTGGKPLFESADIIQHLVTKVTGLWP